MVTIPSPTGVINAKQAFICREEPVLTKICEKYGRNPKECAIKVFYGNPLNNGETLKDALWGDNHDPTNPNEVRKNTKLLVGSKIQNICWWHGKAPRIFAVFKAKYKDDIVACQLTEFVDAPAAPDQKYIDKIHDEINALGKEYKFSEVKSLLNPKDILGGKIVDVQQYAFDKGHKEMIKRLYVEKGRYGKIYYQPVPEIGLHGGPRESEQRIKELGLSQIDFKDKVVWDIGSAGGYFCRYALDRGAKKVIGFDQEDPCFSAFMVSNYLGKFNIDYVSLNLKEGIPAKYEKPDIIFLLSMNFHIPIPERVKEASLVVFEDNGKESRNYNHLDKPWTEWFKDIRFMGRASDQGNCNKPIYHIRK